MRILVDTNVVIRHLTGDPPEMAERATRFLLGSVGLYMPDLLVAETVFVLGSSSYRLAKEEVARLVRSVLSTPGLAVDDMDRLLRALELFETVGLGFPDCYLIALAEASPRGDAIASFDRAIDRVTTVRRVEP